MAMVRRGGRDRAKEWYWRRVLRQWWRSKQGVRAYCLENGLSEPSFYAWRRIIEERNREAARSSQLRSGRQPKASVGDAGGDGRPTDGSPAVPPAFVPVTITSSPGCLEVVLGDGRMIRVPPGFDAATLRQLLAVLQETPPC
jgi:hypothetical protein